jgi:aminopeptidase N
MKTFFLSLLLAVSCHTYAQTHFCAQSKQASAARQQAILSKMSAAASAQISHEDKYDVRFVHLDLNLERTNRQVSGHVTTVATVTAMVMDTFMTLLHQNHQIDSVFFNGVKLSYLRQDSMVKVSLPAPVTSGASFTTMVYYQGTAPGGGSAIGSGLNSANSWYGGGNRATWSLSESFVAYHWWPCKQALTDKIDSSWVFITTDSTNKAGSNGVLENVVVVGNKKRYEWKSRAPIAYYLISVAVSRFREYNFYAKPQYLPNDSILIQNYIDASAWTSFTWISNDKVHLDKMPEMMNFLCDMYGMYPFYKEKYGHCLVPLGGGMEHNTMTTIGLFNYYIDAHELGHQWWGDQVTCASWKDIWINEGFASYTEHLVAEYLDPQNFGPNLNAAHNSIMSQPGGSCHFTDADTMNTPRIFDSRLTYDKGGAIIHTLRFVTNNDSVWFNTLRGFLSTYKHGNASVNDFKAYYQNQTGIDPTQFFDQWYYGEGYPSFNVKYNYNGVQCFIRSTQTTSKPGVTPLFITPVEYRIKRTGLPDTTVRLMHQNSVEEYTLHLSGTVTSVTCDPRNWLINKVSGPSRDLSLGADPDLTGLLQNAWAEQLKIGPNPTKGPVVISNPEGLEGTGRVFDLQGRLVTEAPLRTETVLSLDREAPGVYLLRICDPAGRERFSQKVIRE